MSDCYNARTLEAEAGGQWVWGQPKLHSKTLDSREVQKGMAMEPVFIYMKRSPHVQIKGRSNPHPPVQQTRPHYRLGKFKQVPTRKAPFPVTGVFIRRKKFGPRHLEKVSGEDGERDWGHASGSHSALGSDSSHQIQRGLQQIPPPACL